ncbi:hypothetical protein LIA77_09351 [Sarocladium implicatum]|nr:hypothetical protein LIA77_09351 [Sarocladium implicatum]
MATDQDSRPPTQATRHCDKPTTVSPAWVPKRRRLATVYDAVAGKVSHDQALWDVDNTEAFNLLQGSQAAPNDPSNLAYGSHVKPSAYAPEDVLFRRRNAPERYAEHDVYFANERELPDAGTQGTLPDSDLLKAVHGYASNFYSSLARRERSHVAPGRAVDERSMDETALLAFGILLEEAGREVLGTRGDLTFTEEADPESPDEAHDDNIVAAKAALHQEEHPRSSSTSKTKRRKLATPADER